LRHLYPFDSASYDPDYNSASVHQVQSSLNALLGENGYVFAGVDALSAWLDDRLAPKAG
jgi:hypothetical protein